MDFSAVVERARQLHTEGKDCKSIDLVDGAQVIRAPRQDLTQEVYGRICNTDDPVPPKVLSSTPGRQTVFLFGPDSVSSIILQHNAYDCLCSLGFDKEYICHEVVEKKYKHWLVLFTSAALEKNNHATNSDVSQVVMATWEGILQILRTYYTEVYEDCLQHLDELRSKTVKEFELEAGFEFLEAKKNVNNNNPKGPPFHSYDHYTTLPKPRKAWQVRLFLYCELRLLTLFKGDGYTWTETGRRGTREYICPNHPLSAFDTTQIAVIPMTVVIPSGKGSC